MEKACFNCPLETALNTAEEVVGVYSHNNPDSAKGGIAVTRLCFDKVLENTTCNGPTLNSDGQEVCPQRDKTMFTRSLALSPWSVSNFDVDLKKIGGIEIEVEENINNGMYL